MIPEFRHPFFIGAVATLTYDSETDGCPGNDCDDQHNFEKLFTMWDQWGWHRVTCYGDLKEPVFALANAIGWKVVEEA